MRINPKAYNLASESTPIEVEKFDDKVVEIYYLNDFEELMNEFINKGKFDVWSSEDGVNYRLYIEEGYYKELKELYSQPVNKIGIDFWDACEKITRRSSNRFIIPGTIVAFISCILVSFIPGEVSTWISLGIVVLAFVGMMTIKRFTKKKIYEQNVASVELIKKHVGANRFEKLLDMKKEYMENYYDSLYPDDEESLEEESIEKNVEKNKE